MPSSKGERCQGRIFFKTVTESSSLVLVIGWSIWLMYIGEILYAMVASWLSWKNSSVFLPTSRVKISKHRLFRAILEKYDL